MKSFILPRAVLAWLLLLFFASALLLLSSLGYLQPIISLLDSNALSFFVGDLRLSVYLIGKAVLLTLALFWSSSIALDFVEKRINSIASISSNSRALFIKAVQFIVYFLLFIFTMNVIGIDLTAFAVLGGAIGIGIGFGLQKITSNYISGIILLVERTIENGDLVELDDGTFGFVRHNSARFTLIETFNGKEIMVPNEDFITNKVVNWTYSNKKGRVDIPVGVSYKSDITKARELILEAAREHPRCIVEPEPECYLREYAESSVNFLLIFWVDDVTEGRYKPQSDVMFSIWEKFKANDIAIPFPQRDVHIIDLGQ
ncbi:mechanosensitive ion channel [Mariprofundus sp. KV]|nr:mechanosensitive ion channel [Mariprofundus sp. KV]